MEHKDVLDALKEAEQAKKARIDSLLKERKDLEVSTAARLVEITEGLKALGYKRPNWRSKPVAE